jgi:hypothetical protein
MSGNSVIFLYHIPKTGGTSLREALAARLGLDQGFIHLGPYGDRVRHEKNRKPLAQYTRDELAGIRVVSGHYLSTGFERYFAGREIKRAVLLREPANRILSQYNHAMRNRTKLKEKPVGFREWYEDLALDAFDWPSLSGRKLALSDKKFAIASVGDNYMSKFILDAMGEKHYAGATQDWILSRTKELLEGFWHVGCIENLPASIAALERELGGTLNVGTFNKTGAFSFSKLARHRKMDRRLRDYLVSRNGADYGIYELWCGRNRRDSQNS